MTQLTQNVATDTAASIAPRLDGTAGRKDLM